MRRNPLVIASLALALAGAGVTAGCAQDASESADQGAAPQTVTEVVTEAPVTVTERQRARAPEPTRDAPAEAAESAPPASAGIVVPNVVGEDHQYAQDTMQAAGLYNLAEEDATGQGRLLLWDRNWVVVSQSPAAGTRVADDATIILRSKQDDE